jgi:hypothetical protein
MFSMFSEIQYLKFHEYQTLYKCICGSQKKTTLMHFHLQLHIFHAYFPQNSTQQYITVHSNTKQYTAEHYSSHQYITVHNNTLQFTAIHCSYNLQQYITVHNNTGHNNALQYTAIYYSTQQYMTVHNNTTQYMVSFLIIVLQISIRTICLQVY